MSKYFDKSIDGEEVTLTVKSIPLVLYKFCPNSEHHFKALINDEIWGTTPSCFNDPYDSILCIDKKCLKTNIVKRIGVKRLKKYIELFNCRTKKELVSILIDRLSTMFSQIVRQEVVVSCFSETINSEIMWAHYASCAKGFAIGYSGDSLKKCADEYLEKYNQTLYCYLNTLGVQNNNYIPNMATIFPIQYENGKGIGNKSVSRLVGFLFQVYDGIKTKVSYNDPVTYSLQSTIDLSVCNQNFNRSILYTALCKKSKNWKYEKEWRIWGYNINKFLGSDSPYLKIGNVKPNGIYLGEYISDYDKQAMQQIAKQKGIPIYQMKTKSYRNNYILMPELLQ